ncbi:uncharacterized protein TM35_000182730 [Trypanosoma theileri]|uniref:Uncharacterized protein n=1 Tax=Trypanosoma theileri TaxID=67003 RepID=A0A1X0NU30_9TRYP|nr:uncharacterized protein TM35_000182730 [Trypanosoma theileri]ORC88216.1 hypothetical protein TM35_000182730 [Trypanosoma theileri]
MRRCCSFSGNGPSPLLTSVVYARHHINGFSLFARELQEHKGILKARSFRHGRDNMRVVSQHWHQLTPGQRHRYNARAREILVLKAKNTDKAFNDFNLLMQLLFQTEDVAGAGDEVFTAHMAKNTLTQLNSGHKEKLRKKLLPKDVIQAPKKSGTVLPLSWYFPHMRYFESFVEMLRAVAPTQKALFIAVSRVLDINRRPTKGYMSSISKKYDQLTEEDKDKFKPITDEDAPVFEKYCASHCATFDIENFDIVRLFAQYRGLITARTSLPEPEATQYKMLMEADRFRESLYFKALRNLERAKAGRSTDHGTYISHIHPEGVSIPPQTYSIKTSMDDVVVATLLAETRLGKSVYDDVIERTSCFRQEMANQLLQETYLSPERKTKREEKKTSKTKRNFA